MKATICNRIENWKFDNTFIIDVLNKKKYSYNSFFSLMPIIEKRFAAAGKNIVCIMDNSFELSLCYFSIILSGRVIVAIDPQKEHDEIAGIIDSLYDKFIIVDDAGRRKVDCYDLLITRDYLSGEVKYDGSNVKEDILRRIKKINFDDDCLLTFTSGTSGNTKGVRNSLNNLCKSADAFNKFFNVSADNVFAHVMPMTYMAGILNSIIQPFIAGSRIVIMGRFSPMVAFSFWQTVESERINTFWLSPTMLTIIMKVGNEIVGKNYCSKNPTTFFIGTAPLHMTTRKDFENKYGVKLYASYGLSETLFLSTETPETIVKSCDNVGTLLDGVKYRFSQAGEFLVDVPWMFLGYTNEPTDNYFDGTYYKTGDLAEINNDILSIVGRCKDLIVKGGMNISPALIEKVVITIPGIEECAVFGSINSYKEEIVVLAYTSSVEDTQELEKIVYSVVVKQLGRNYLIDSFYKVSQIPKNINGKIDKNALKAKYESEIKC